MSDFSCTELLSCPLPEDIQRAKISGNLDWALRLIDARLTNELLPTLMKERLELERILIKRALRRYPYDRQRAIEVARGRIEGFTGEELDAYELNGDVDYIYVNGEKRYLSSFAGALIKMHPALEKRKISAPEPDDGVDLERYISEIKRDKSAAWRFKIKSSLKIEDECFEPGELYTVHIPVPAACAQQPEEEISIRADADALIAPPDAMHRAVCYKRRLEKNAPFEVEFSYTSQHQYVSPMSDEARIVYPNVPAPCADDLSEQLPHICFTPFLKALARQIAGEETRPLYLAKRVYDYVTSHVRYSFMRSYILIDRHAEYAAANLKGDCGIQAILFITLCRILGVPARWQSGLTVDKFSTGDHDWAQFWTEEFGWLFADPSYGGGAYRRGNFEKREFYFGNLDPFRMIANRRYLSDFDEPKRFMRCDPCDSQDGEVESEKEGLDSNCYDKTDTTLEFIRL